MQKNTLHTHRNVITAIAVLLILFFLHWHLKFHFVKRRLEPIAEQLLRTQSSASVYQIGDATAKELTKIASLEQVTWQVLRGDIDYPYGNGEADAHIVYSIENKHLLVLRIGCSSDAVHVLGYRCP